MSGIRTAILAIGNDQTGTDGWTSNSDVWTYASASTFTIAGDVTGKYQKGDKVKLTQTTVKYFYIIGLSFGSGITTITITGGSDYALANAAITLTFYSKSSNPQGFPTFFNWSPSLVGFSSDPTSSIYRFNIIGNACTLTITQGANGTSNATSFTISLPVTAGGLAGETWAGATGVPTDNGAALSAPALWQISQGSTTISLFKAYPGTTWTATAGKRVATIAGFYEI